MNFPFLLFFLFAFGKAQFFNFEDSVFWKRPKKNLMIESAVKAAEQRDVIDDHFLKNRKESPIWKKIWNDLKLESQIQCELKVNE